MELGDITFSTAPSGRVPLGEVALRLHPQDNVAIAKIDLGANIIVALGPQRRFPVRQPIPSGHKMALQEIAAGEPVRRYGQIIGLASRPMVANPRLLHLDRTDTGGDRSLGQVAVADYLAAALGVTQLGSLLDPIVHFFLDCLRQHLLSPLAEDLRHHVFGSRLWQ